MSIGLDNEGPGAGPGSRASAEAPAPGATVVTTHPDAAPPAGEEIHLPPGTPLPLLMALGITMGLVGVTIGWIWTILGGLLFIITLVLWIRDTKHEVDHLPDEIGAPTH